MDLTTLYKKDKLYKIADQPKTDDVVTAIKPENFNGVAVLYEYPSSAVLPTAEEAFVNKIIEAGMKLNPAETFKANISHSGMTMQKVSEAIGAKKVVLFGTAWIEALRNGHIDKNEIFLLYGMKVLVTDTLDEINKNDNAKKIFWGHLKKMF